jgi:ribosome biogenesis protein MAK21
MKASMPSVKDGDIMINDESSLESDDEGHFLHSDGESGEDGLVDDFDNESFVSTDQDAPEGLIEYESDDDDDRRGDKKRKREASEGRGVRKKKPRTLPTFASYDEYARMIEDGTDEDL